MRLHASSSNCLNVLSAFAWIQSVKGEVERIQPAISYNYHSLSAGQVCLQWIIIDEDFW